VRVKEPGIDESKRVGIWVQARQHAWESGSSWVCKGFLDWIISGDAEAVRLRQSAEIVFVPIMDIDNVILGAGGKEEAPRDHNRDWTEAPHWRSVEAAQHEILAMNDRLGLFLDLHNPDRKPQNPFFYVAPDEVLSEAGRQRLDQFLQTVREEMTEPLAFQGHTRGRDFSGYGKDWKNMSSNWVAINSSDRAVAVTLETPFNTPHSLPAGYEHVGRGLGRAVDRFFFECPLKD
jgi:hypothetical protein